MEFIHYIVKNKEQNTSIKHILMEFQREYERNNKECSSYKDDDENTERILNQRLTWLNSILNMIDFSSEEWKSKLQLIRKNLKELNINECQNYDFSYAIIGYFIYLTVLPERNIKEKLKQHFKRFKYKEN